MKDLTYSTKITAPVNKVWDTMLSLETYEEWTGVCWPGSTFHGNWEPGGMIKFTGPGGAGTLVKIISYQLHDHITAEHITILKEGGEEDRDSDQAKTWVGAIEKYVFTETGGETELTVTMTIHPDWEEMFNKDWPKALAKLKEICER